MFLDGDQYLLFPGICEIPFYIWNSSSRIYILVEVTRAVCRSLCTVAYNNYCNGFLYFPANQTCIISPYSGALVTNRCEIITIAVEFYRRIGVAGKNYCLTL